LISFVSERDKDLLWGSVTAHFTLPAGEDLKNLVKSWALKNLTLDFSENSPYKKLRDDRPEFVRYKTSEEG
jgi:hypothetical protein